MFLSLSQLLRAGEEVQVSAEVTSWSSPAIAAPCPGCRGSAPSSCAHQDLRFSSLVWRWRGQPRGLFVVYKRSVFQMGWRSEARSPWTCWVCLEGEEPGRGVVGKERKATST